MVASIRSSGASQSTIKLVATNLIASGKLQEGVQLLCLIDKGLDACRYLQTYGAWEQAVWLAKSTLDYNDCCEVMKRWVDHLCSTHVNQKVRYCKLHNTVPNVIFSTVILSLPLIQEGQLSVSGERMCTILVNRLED